MEIPEDEHYQLLVLLVRVSILLRDISKALVVMALPSAMKGKHYRFQGITPHQAEKIVIEASTPLWIHTDGEVTRKSKKITVSCNQQCLNMIY